MSTASTQRFQTLLDEHKRILYKICRSYGRGADDREDLAQEIAVQLWRSFASYDESRRFSTWMYRIALNVAISHYRREAVRTHRLISDEERLLEVADERPTQSGEVELLYEFIDGLDPLNRALVLMYLDGNSQQEIADVLGIGESNVGTKLSRIRKAMTQRFGTPGK